MSTTADSNLRGSVQIAGSAAESAAQRKKVKYKELAETYIFVPVVIESLGSMCKEAQSFLTKVGERMAKATGEQNSTSYIRQAVSIAIQRGNVRCVTGTTEITNECQAEEDILTNM